MILGWLTLIVFFGIWIGYAVHGKRRGKSGVERIGGGFLAAVTCVGLFVYGATEFLKEYDPDTPETLAQAGISGKKWDALNVNLAAKITLKNLKAVRTLLDDANKRGDGAAAARTLDPLLQLVAEWNNQDANRLGGYRNCLLASIHLADGAGKVFNGGHFLPDRYEATLAECRRAIH